MDDAELKRWQAETRRRLKADMLAAAADHQSAVQRDPHHAARQTFLNNLVEIRLRQHLTQHQLAKRAGMTQPVLARIESGKGNPGLNTLLAIAKALQVDLVLK